MGHSWTRSVITIYTLDISPHNITHYCTQHNSLECRTSAILRTHEWQPIPRPYGWALVVIPELFGEKWPRDIGSSLYCKQCCNCKGRLWTILSMKSQKRPTPWACWRGMLCQNWIFRKSTVDKTSLFPKRLLFIKQDCFGKVINVSVTLIDIMKYVSCCYKIVKTNKLCDRNKEDTRVW